MVSINAIGGGMQGMMGMQGMVGMPGGMQDMQSVQGPKDMKEMQGLEKDAQKQPKPEEMQAQGINQQDKTEMSDEAQEIGGAAHVAAQIKETTMQSITQQVKDTVQQIIDEAKVQGPGQQGQHQGTNQKVEMLKQQLGMAQQNGTPIDSSVKEAADHVIQGDIKGADQILNGQQKEQGAAQGLNQEQQVGKAQETHADKIVAGIQGMQIPQQ